jgi:hypothetical protein
MADRRNSPRSGDPVRHGRQRAFATATSGHRSGPQWTFRAIEDNLLSCTLWNYTSDNTNSRGDQWNDEDLSLFSRDQQIDKGCLDSGGRALEAAVRPYPRAVAGDPLGVAFEPRSGAFEFTMRDDPGVSAPTEVFVPELQYPGGPLVSVSDGSWESAGWTILVFRHGRG